MSRPKADEQTIQDKMVEQYSALRYRLPYARAYHDWWMREMIALAGSDRLTGTVLDNGCGTGHIAALLPDARCAVGLDLSFRMLNEARRRFALCVQGDSLHLPFPDRSFDLVFARSLLHHLSDPAQGVREISRVLKSGGRAVFADTNRSIISALPRKIAYQRDSFSEQHQNFQRRDYLAWISQSLHIDRVRHFGYLAYPFGFPDMMGPLHRLPIPPALVRALIQLDSGIAQIPGLRTQSWGILVLSSRL